jgi:hypothetical protein
MTHSEVGVMLDSPLLQADWHTRLSDPRLAAYVRYQFIWQKENVWDWDTSAHARARKSWDGGVDNYGTKYSSRWMEAVRVIRGVRAQPGMWVHAQFSPVAERILNPATSSLPEIHPSALYSRRAQSIYERYVGLAPADIRSNFELAGKTITARMSSSRDLGLTPAEQELYVLCDESYVTAPPFFRHAFAAAAQCQEAVETYLWLAALDYEVHQTAYDAVIEETQETWWITEPLLLAVASIRGHWENYRG